MQQILVNIKAKEYHILNSGKGKDFVNSSNAGKPNFFRVRSLLVREMSTSNPKGAPLGFSLQNEPRAENMSLTDFKRKILPKEQGRASVRRRSLKDKGPIDSSTKGQGFRPPLSLGKI